MLPIVAIHGTPVDFRGMPQTYIMPGELGVWVTLLNMVQPIDVMEIGTHEGRSARIILDHVNSVRSYFGIDVEPGYIFKALGQTTHNEIPEVPGRYALADHRYHLIIRKRGSFDIDSSPQMDAVIIDGDHCAEAVINDTTLARRIIRPGGVIIWHDYCQNNRTDVPQTLESFRAQGAPIFHAKGTHTAFEFIRK
jgi:predicted O-methyltransferase YrrM